MYPKDEVGMGIRRQRIIRDSRKYATECLKRKKEDGKDEAEEHPPQEWRRHGSTRRTRKRRVQLEHVGEEERGLEQLEMSPGEKRRRVRGEAQPKKVVMRMDPERPDELKFSQSGNSRLFRKLERAPKILIGLGYAQNSSF